MSTIDDAIRQAAGRLQLVPTHVAQARPEGLDGGQRPPRRPEPSTSTSSFETALARGLGPIGRASNGIPLTIE